MRFKKNLRDLGSNTQVLGERLQQLVGAAEELSTKVGVVAACKAIGVSRAMLYRRRKPIRKPKPRKESSRELTDEERQAVLDTLHCSRFVDKASAEVYAILLDEGRYLCSIRTMHRLLGINKEVAERRNQLRHPVYKKPELLATAPNQVWSWDITKLLGPVTWSYFYLYVILDIYSRYVVGWMLASRESAELAKRLIEETLKKQGITPGQLTIHADRGSSMKSKPVALLMSDLGVTKTHSRPHTSDDNPYSETLKYHPSFPGRFGSIEDARAFCQCFFPWYNTEHHHGGIGLLTPEDMHYGRAAQITSARQTVLSDAYDKHPERFVKRRPIPPLVPQAAWINPPRETESTANRRLALDAE